MDGTRYILAGRLIDGSGNDVRRNVFLAVQGAVITAIGPVAALPGDDGAVVDDFMHCTLLPALVDCSVSLSRSSSVDKRVQAATREAGIDGNGAMLERHIRYCHGHGVLGVADSGDISGLVKYPHEGITQGSGVGIRTSGPLCLSSSDCLVENPPDRDFLKIGYSGNIEDETAPGSRLSHEQLRHILQQRGGKKVVVVANGPQPVAEALEAGCHAIEQGYLMGKDNLRKMADNNILWIPSILRAKNALDGSGTGGEVCCRFSLRYVAPGKAVPGDEVFWKKMVADQLAQLRFAGELGVTTAVGTGAGSAGILHGESMAEEMKLFLKAGYSMEETVRCASKNGAEFFGMEVPGPLAVGRNATFLIVRGTVKQLPRKLSYLEGIYVNGLPSTTYRKM